MRRSASPFAFFPVLVVSGLLTACGGDDSKPTTPPVGGTPAAATAKVPDTKEGLGALVAEWKAAHKANDEAKLKKLAHDIVPTTADLKSVLVEGPATDAFLAAYGAKDLKADDPSIAAFAGTLLKPKSDEQSEVGVHAATTEELVAYKEGSVAHDEFPGGMKTLAANAKPKVTWYVVELLEPGNPNGMKYTCFVHAGGRFVFLAKPWRALGGTDK